MAVGVEQRFRIDPSTVDKDGHKSSRLAVFRTYNGNGLAGLHPIAHLHKILGIPAIDRLQAIVVPDDDSIAIAGRKRQTYSTAEHGFHGITFCRGNVQILTVYDFCITNRQGKEIVVLAQRREIDAEGIAAGKEIWRWDEDLLLLGLGKMNGTCCRR